jgi:hypothetical protein
MNMKGGIMAPQPLSLANLAGGAAIERFDLELNRVLENIADPNTSLKQRKISLDVIFKPDDRREGCEITVSCSAKLAGMREYGSHIYIDSRRPGLAFEADPRQMSLEFDESQKEETGGKTVPMRRAE